MQTIPTSVFTIDEFLEQYSILTEIYQSAQTAFFETKRVENEKYINCIQRCSCIIKFLDNLNMFVVSRHKDAIKETYYISAELLVRTVGLNSTKSNFTENEKNTLYIAIAHLRKALDIEPFHKQSQELFRMIFLFLTIYNPNVQENITYLNQVLVVDPCDYQLHYNLAFMFHRVNQLDSSLYHYKLAVGILDMIIEKEKLADKNVDGLQQFKIKCLNGLGSIYFTIQNRDLALYYFNLAAQIDPLDPDINNQIGVVYTELRSTDKAIEHYEKGIKYYKRAHISVDKEMLVASMYMNMGLAKCYECDFTNAIECYNKALKYKPRLSLAYQNKLLDVNYISHLIEDPMYISRLHKSINKIYPKVIENWKEGNPNYKIKNDFFGKTKAEILKRGKKLKIGFVSGDFICHPVAYFIHSILNHINYDLFDVYCYSVKVVKLDEMFKQCNWFVVKNKDAEQLADLIRSHEIDVLFDLSAHTGDNRLDTFVLKPAPIQISYCGYPNSSGIKSMDYHITDTYCDSEFSQKYYQEKLVFMKRCFLSYTPSMGIKNIPEIPDTQPCITNGYVTFGCFNRYNKINSMVIGVWEKILQRAPTARFVIKTKEFLTPKLKQQFLDTFQDKSVLERVIILPYSDTYQEHLPDYNKMDISLDTFPYSGTTTSCESLMMGVPILTCFDNIRHYHSQNVTTSLMKNSNLPEFVAYSQEEYISKAVEYATNFSALADLKKRVRSNFVNGAICDYTGFVNEFEDQIISIYQNHTW
jgi:predicted O-linked N-acetylglucosamine transferase (SPINDLY family)